jgi:hypothetical protein
MQIFYHNVGFREKRNFLAENWQKYCDHNIDPWRAGTDDMILKIFLPNDLAKILRFFSFNYCFFAKI